MALLFGRILRFLCLWGSDVCAAYANWESETFTTGDGI